MLAATLTRISEPYTAGCTTVIVPYLSFFEEVQCQIIELQWLEKNSKITQSNHPPTSKYYPLNHIPKYHTYMFPSFAGGSEQSTFQRNSSTIHASLNQSRERRLILQCLMPAAHPIQKAGLGNSKSRARSSSMMGTTGCFYLKGWSLTALLDSYLPSFLTSEY